MIMNQINALKAKEKAYFLTYPGGQTTSNYGMCPLLAYATDGSFRNINLQYSDLNNGSYYLKKYCYSGDFFSSVVTVLQGQGGSSNMAQYWYEFEGGLSTVSNLIIGFASTEQRSNCMKITGINMTFPLTLDNFMTYVLDKNGDNIEDFYLYNATLASLSPVYNSASGSAIPGL